MDNDDLLNQDFEKKALDAQNQVANTLAILDSMNIDEHHHEDNVSINSNDLDLADLDKEDNDADIGQMFGDNNDDDDLDGLLDDMIGDDLKDLDLDDPKALEMLENHGKPKPKPKPSAAKPATQPATTQTAPAVGAKPVAAAKPTSEPAGKTETSATKPATAETSKQKPASMNSALTKQRNEEYNALKSEVTANMKALETQVKYLLTQKNEKQAEQYRAVYKKSMAFMKMLNEYQTAGKDVPPVTHTSLPLSTERVIEGIGEEQLKIQVLTIINIKSDAKYSLKFDILYGKSQSKHSKTVKGKDIVSFNQDIMVDLFKGIRQNSESMKKIQKMSKITVELHSHGMLWGSTVVATGEFKTSPLLTKCESRQVIKLKDDDSKVIGELECVFQLSRPFHTAELITNNIQYVKLDEAPPSAAAAVPSFTTAPTTAPAAPTKSPTTAVAPAPPKPKEVNIDEMTPAQILKASGAKLNPDVFKKIHDLPDFMSMDSCTKEIEEMKQMIATGKYSRGLTDALSCKERISLLEMRVMMFEAAVGAGKMSLEEYMDLCRGQLEIEKKLVDPLVVVTKWYHANGKKESTKLYNDIVMWVKRRIEWLQEEIDNAPDGEDEDEE